MPCFTRFVGCLTDIMRRWVRPEYTQSSQMEDQNSIITKLRSEMESISTENNNRKNELDSMRLSLEEANATIASLNKKNESLMKSVDTLTTLTETKQNELNELKSTILSLQEMIGIKDEKIVDLGATNSSLQAELEDKNAKIYKTTIRGRFAEISKLTFDNVYSQPTHLDGIDWQLVVYKDDDDLEIRLMGQNPNGDKWSCPVSYELQLISQKNENAVHNICQDAFYFTNSEAFGHSVCTSFTDLFDDDKGFVKNDSIVLAASMKFIPTDENGHTTTIRATFTEMSKLQAYHDVYSQPTHVDGTDWRIEVYKGSDNLNVRLKGEKPNGVKWSCATSYEFQFISQKNENIVHTMESKTCFFTESHSSGYGGCISIKDLFDEDKGFVKDDSIILAVSMKFSLN